MALKSLKILTTMAALLVATATGASAQNLLANPNFEDGPTGFGAEGWEAFGNFFTEADNGADIIPCEGSQVMKSFGLFSGEFNVGGVFQEFPSTPGEEWSLACTARHSALDPMIGGGAPDANWVVQKISFFDAGGIEIGAAETTILDGTFATDTCHVAAPTVGVAPEGTTAVQALILYLQPGFDGGAAQVDECELLNLTNPPEPTLSVSPDPLVAGQDATVTVEFATPDAATYLAYSLTGLGSTFVAPLNVTVDLDSPIRLGPVVTTDSNGMAQWTLSVPAAALGSDVWLQSAQFESTTNVVATTVVEAAGNLLTNGDFEAGDLSGWEIFGAGPNADVSIVMGDNGPAEPGDNSAFMDNQELALSLTLKQSTAPGSASEGDVSYSFDLKLGEAAVGGVFFVEIFAEQVGGGVISGTGVLGTFTPGDWETFTGTFAAPAGTDFLTMQLSAITGGADGSISTMSVDNVSLSQ